MTECVLFGYEPQKLYEHFENISAIPRGSGNEKGIADYLCAFAETRGLAYNRDALHNVLIKKAGTTGYETHAPVILQGHTDMVCEKNEDTAHDFLRDGLKLVVRDGWLYADGTTLGADDGAAVAIMLALLEDDTAEYPPLECMFTVQEETGMDGAYGFDYTKLAGRTLINLDSEALDVATVSCAGGVVSDLTFTLKKQPVAGTQLKLSLTGLAGGHSGVDIHKGRANAVRLMGTLLARLAAQTPLRLSAIHGRNKSNAIPRECSAWIVTDDAQTAAAQLADIADGLKAGLCAEDSGFQISVDAAQTVPTAFSSEDTLRLLRCINDVPNGVLSYTPAAPELVEASSNLGIVRTDGETVTLTLMPRSSSEIKLDAIIGQIDALAGELGAQVAHHDRHPGWEYAPESRIRAVYTAAYEALFDATPKTEAIHAGLECGIIGEKLGGIDAVSIGPDMREIHTPNEHLNLKSFADAYALVKAMLARL